MNKKFLTQLQDDIKRAIDKVAKKHNVVFDFRGGTYADTHATLKLTVSCVSKQGTVLTRERAAYIQYARSYGMDPNWIDESFTGGLHGYECILIGLKTRSKKFPVIAKRVSDGKLFKFTASGVIAAFDRKEGVPA
jgi:hypothetical protein